MGTRITVTMFSLALFALFGSAAAGSTLPGSPNGYTPPSLRSKLLRLKGGEDKVDMVLVGCGAPKRGMGWYHGTQLLDGDIPSGRLDAVVEPFFMGPGKDTPPGKAFNEFAEETK